MPKAKLVYNKKIRSVWNSRRRKHYYCLNDFVKALKNVKDPKNYLKDMRKRNPELSEKWKELVKPFKINTTGGLQSLKCTDKKGLLLIVQYMRSSNKTESFIRWVNRQKYR
jgi:DNA-damage-inducible protein D